MRVLIFFVSIGLWLVVAIRGLTGEPINLTHFQSSSVGNKAFSFTETTNLLPERTMGAQIHFSFFDNLARLADEDGNLIETLVEERYLLDLSASLAFRCCSIDVFLPLIAYQNEPDRPLVGLSDYSQSGIGDIRLMFKWPFFRGRNGIGFGIFSDVELPTATADFIGHSSPGGGLGLIFDYHSQYFRFAQNLGFSYFKAEEFLTTKTGMSFGSKSALSFRLIRAYDIHAFAEYLMTIEALEFKEAQMPAEVIGGVQFMPIKNLQIKAGYGRSLTTGLGSAEYRIFFSAGFVPSKRRQAPVYWTAPGISIQGNQIIVSRELRFRSDSDFLDGGSAFTLDAFAETLSKNSWINRIQINALVGRGPSAATSLHLANRRAKKIKQELVLRGIPASKLKSQGLLSYEASGANSREDQQFEFIIESKREAVE